MKQLNEVHLRGRVGNIRIQAVGEKTVCHFTVATSNIYRSAEAGLVETTQWHNCTCWGDRKVPDFNLLTKGCAVDVKGSIRYEKYTGSDGVERTTCDINVAELNLLQGLEGPTGPSDLM